MNEAEMIMKEWTNPDGLKSSLDGLAERRALRRIVEAERAVVYGQAGEALEIERARLDASMLEHEEKIRLASAEYERAAARCEAAQKAAALAKTRNEPDERLLAVAAADAVGVKIQAKKVLDRAIYERDESHKRRAAVLQALALVSPKGG